MKTNRIGGWLIAACLTFVSLGGCFQKVEESAGTSGGGGEAGMGGSGGGASVDCTRDSECDDGKFCTTDSCDKDNGVCVTSARDCDDGKDTTADACDEAKNLCTHTVGECADDGDCNDAIACTTDVCGADAKCKHFADDSACSAGKTCDVDLGCVACAVDSDCNDGITCTTDICTSSHACKHVTDDALCSDGNANTTDTCDSVAGCLHVASGAETCNGIDDDSDGQVDEGNPGGGIVCQTGLAGACSAGTTKCSGGVIICNQNIVAVSETIAMGNCGNGIDDDCDGAKDLADSACQNVNAETCNGFDDNANGQVDENNPGGGIACSTGFLGACAAGTTLCQNGQIVCHQTNAIGVESSGTATCLNGVDDDCDGTTDAGDSGCQQCQNGQQLTCAYGGPANTLGIGLCKAGVQTCSSGVYGACIGQVTPVAEVCNNGLDDDCNGAVDNNCGNCVNGQSQACYTGANGTSGVGVCHGGTQTCGANNQWGACLNQVVPAASDVCANNADDNCNGAVDEGCGNQQCPAISTKYQVQLVGGVAGVSYILCGDLEGLAASCSMSWVCSQKNSDGAGNITWTVPANFVPHGFNIWRGTTDANLNPAAGSVALVVSSGNSVAFLAGYSWANFTIAKIDAANVTTFLTELNPDSSLHTVPGNNAIIAFYGSQVHAPNFAVDGASGLN